MRAIATHTRLRPTDFLNQNYYDSQIFQEAIKLFDFIKTKQEKKKSTIRSTKKYVHFQIITYAEHLQKEGKRERERKE